jgi:hypothetical protein
MKNSFQNNENQDGMRGNYVRSIFRDILQLDFPSAKQQEITLYIYFYFRGFD